MSDIHFTIVEETFGFSVTETPLYFSLVEETLNIVIVEEQLHFPQLVEEIQFDIVEERLHFQVDAQIPATETVASKTTTVPAGQTIELDQIVVSGWGGHRWSLAVQSTDSKIQISEVSSLPFDDNFVDWQRYQIQGFLFPMRIFCTRDNVGNLILSITNNYTQDFSVATTLLG